MQDWKRNLVALLAFVVVVAAAVVEAFVAVVAVLVVRQNEMDLEGNLHRLQ